MRIQIEPTPKIVRIDGQRMRAWRGVTENGVACVVFVSMIAVPRGIGAEAFKAELQEIEISVVEAD